MTNEQAALKLSLHLFQCGMLMPIKWLETNGKDSDTAEAFRLAIAALRAQDTPNQPLTLEELRGMDGEPVWVEPMQQWRIVAVDHENEFVKLFTVFNTISAKSILNDDGRIYRRKLEEPKHTTHADRFRAMTNEELAVTLPCPNEMGLAEIACDHGDDKNCYACLLDWLNKPEEEK